MIRALPVIGALTFALIVLVLGFGSSGCSSDADTPLGSRFYRDGILGSRPGEVFAETLRVSSGDTSVHVSSLIAHDQWLSLSLSPRYRSAPVLRFDLSSASVDSGKPIRSASIRLRLSQQSQALAMIARFYELVTPFSEGDTLVNLALAPDAIPDSSGTNVQREMKLVGDYSLPPGLVEEWLAGNKEHMGIAVVPDPADTTLELQFGARENEDQALHPFLDVTFWDGSSGFYPVAHDGTFYDTLATSANLVLSDGFTRRIHLPVDLSGVRRDAIIHNAELELSIFPTLALGADLTVEVYAPGSSDPRDVGFRQGQLVTTLAIDPASDRVVFPVRNIMLLFLSGSLSNHGLVLKFADEGSSLRHMEFYSSSAQLDMRPRLRMTYSSAPEFDGEDR